MLAAAAVLSFFFFAYTKPASYVASYVVALRLERATLMAELAAPGPWTIPDPNPSPSHYAPRPRRRWPFSRRG